MDCIFPIVFSSVAQSILKVEEDFSIVFSLESFKSSQASRSCRVIDSIPLFRIFETQVSNRGFGECGECSFICSYPRSHPNNGALGLLFCWPIVSIRVSRKYLAKLKVIPCFYKATVAVLISLSWLASCPQLARNLGFRETGRDMPSVSATSSSSSRIKSYDLVLFKFHIISLRKVRPVRD